MTFEEFVDLIISKVTLSFDKENKKHSLPYYDRFCIYNPKRHKKRKLEELMINKSWCVGGLTGGGYDGQQATSVSAAEDEPEFSDLDIIIETLKPDITFMSYKKLMIKIRNRLKSEDIVSYEYYGNHTIYRVIYIKLKDLYDIFKEEWKDL